MVEERKCPRCGAKLSLVKYRGTYWLLCGACGFVKRTEI